MKTSTRFTPHRRALAALCALFITCGFALAQAQAPATRPARSTPREQSKFLRFVPEDRGGPALQTSIVRYQNEAGVIVDLVGAVHIADHSYFQTLNERFKDYDAVLYEMVRPRGAATPAKNRAAGNGQGDPSGRPRGGALSWIGTLQRFLRDHLDLEFQLESIDYERTNFVHADLELEDFLEMQRQRGESFFKLMLNAMVREAARNPTGAGQPGLGEVLVALQSPDRARQLKLVLARQFEQMEDVLAGMEGPKGSVIITERNKAALKVLENRIKQGDDQLAIFYGAGHLKGIEQILTEDMGFKQAGEPEWLIAWDLTAPPSTQPGQSEK